MTTAAALANLIDALQMLAAESRDQLRRYPEYVNAAEEIAINLENAVLLVEQEPDDGRVPQWLLVSIHELDAELETMSTATNAKFWSNDSLASDLRWHRIRVRSREILKQLGVSPQLPPSGDTFVKADSGDET